MRASSRTHIRVLFVMTLALASVTLIALGSMAAVTVADLPTALPSSLPRDGEVIDETLSGQTVSGDLTSGVDLPAVSTGELDPDVGDLVGGDGGGTEQESGAPDPNSTGGTEPASSSQPRTGSTTAETSGRAGTGTHLQQLERTGTRAPEGSTNALDRAVRLAGPFAPAVVIAALGLLALAGAARGNDRLIKRGPEGSSRAGAWRL